MRNRAARLGYDRSGEASVVWLSSARVLALLSVVCQIPRVKLGLEIANGVARPTRVAGRTCTDCVIAVGALACAFGAVVLMCGAAGAGHATHMVWASALPLALALDDKVPALLFKVSHYPLSHGSLGAIRSLGRLGVSGACRGRGPPGAIFLLALPEVAHCDAGSCHARPACHSGGARRRGARAWRQTNPDTNRR